MSRGEREIDDTLPAGGRAAERGARPPIAEQPTLSSACARPRRYGLASRMEKAKAAAALFDEPAETVKVGRYELIEYVGGGGMGEVYAAYDPKLKTEVALKLVRADRGRSPDAAARLLQEAEALAQLDHPNVVHMYDAGAVDDQVFLVMKLIRGRSLRVWLETLDLPRGRARMRTVIRHFVAAGRGLEAAHEKSLVHRDFKPDNVLVGDDGRVRVVDFGLARLGPRPATPAYPASNEPAGAVWLDDDTQTVDDRSDGQRPRRRLARVLTSYGQVMGTPSYMSLEQMRGKDADHRSDQFSFCVSLYEALYLQKPFYGSLYALEQAVERGEIAAPPRGSAVPEVVRKAIWRGLAADPAARFPSMGALLDVLEPWQEPRPWWPVVAASASAATLGAILLIVICQDECREVGAPVADLWTPERRSAIRDQFLATDLSYAEATWSTLEPGLDRYVARLESEMVTTCKATRGQEEGELAVQRMLCLASRQRRLDALLDQLERADASVVEHAPVAAAELPDLAACEDTTTLLHGMKPPADEGQVGEIREHLAEARTQELLGKSDEALRIAETQREHAQNLSYGPVQAEALYQVGRMLANRDTPGEREEGESMLLRAVTLAESERHDELVAELWNFLVRHAERNDSNTERSRQWYDRADAAIRRIGNLASYRAAALRNLARIHLKDGEFPEAEAAQRQALALVESETSGLALAESRYGLGIILHQRGRYRDALDLYESALALFSAQLGPTHPRLAEVRFAMALSYQSIGDIASARQLLESVLLVHGETPGDAHLVVGNTHLALAELDRESGELDSAQDHLNEFMSMYQGASELGHGRLAAAYLRLGTFEYRLGAYEKALAAYEKSLAINTRYLGATHIDVGYDEMNIAEVRLALEQYDEALVAIERAEQILQPHLAEMPNIPPFLASVRGRAFLAKGELPAAVAALERAVQGFAALPADLMPVERADVGWALVQALSQSGRADDPRALTLAREARAIYERQGNDVQTPRREVQRWLDEHERR